MPLSARPVGPLERAAEALVTLGLRIAEVAIFGMVTLIAAEVIRQCELRPRIRLVTPGTLPKTEFKARRVIDRRDVL